MSTGIFGGINAMIWGGGKRAKKIYGQKPVVPELPTLEEAQGSAIGSNIKSFGEASKLASLTNQFNQTELEALIDRALPGGRQAASNAITAMLRGDIPDDVSNAVKRATAEQAMAGGYGSSGFSRNLTARDLGLTSLQLTQQGINSAEQWLSVAAAPSFDVTSMFITPMQRYGDQGNQFQRQLMANKIAAAPDPVARGEFDTTMAIIGMVLSAYGGGAGYQGNQNQQLQQVSQGGAYGPPAPQQNSFYLGGRGYGVGKQQGGGWFMGAGPGPG